MKVFIDDKIKKNHPSISYANFPLLPTPPTTIHTYIHQTPTPFQLRITRPYCIQHPKAKKDVYLKIMVTKCNV